MSWYEKIDLGPFLWFGCFVFLILMAWGIRAGSETPEGKLLADLCLLGAGAVAPRIRSSKPVA
jgi:hypothetical protein